MTKTLLPNPSKATLYMRAWRAAHPEYVAKQKEHQKRRLSDPKVIAEARLRAKKWQQDNRARALENKKRAYEADPKKYRARSKAWIAANLDRHRKYQREYQSARAAKVRGSMQCDQIDYDAVVVRCGGVCGICRLPTGPKFHFDHIVPVAKEGPHTEENLQVAHAVCNKLKSDKIGFRIRATPELFVSC